jgi:acetyl-CoA carboxylase carboxyltransferase component
MVSGMQTVLEDLRARHAAVLDDQRPGAVAKQRAKSALTARERIALLLDPGAPFTETGALVEPFDPALTAPADAIIVGFGPVHGRISVVVSYDYTVLGGSQGVYNHQKSVRAMALADRLEAPLFILAEGGGARTQELLGHNSMLGLSSDFELLARLSGRVPLIGVALGRAFAGHAIFLGECDAIIATERAAIGVAGPPLVKASTGQDLTPEEIGGARIHEAAGAAELIVPDDETAMRFAREYASYFVQPVVADAGAEPDAAGVLRALAFAGAPRDVRRVVALVADRRSMLELRPTWTADVVTALARVGGRAVAFAAASGALTADGCDKLARFLDLCDAHGLPLVLMLDTPGALSGPEAAPQALFRHAARITLAFETVRERVHVATIVVGEVGGVAQVLLGRFGHFVQGAPQLMWPAARVTGLGARDGGALASARHFVTDDVIDPGLTRDALRTLLEATPLPGPRRPRQPIDPW